ncbi:MAG: hypothetical protein GX638_15185 [Crenarchaeota archaeon]|nr:hypothetical protein [Thermoproteota archaeon]
MNECLQIIFSGIVALSTVVYAVLTWRLVSETRKTREIQVTPDIHVFFEKSEADVHFVYIVLENFGYGIAYNTTFEIIKDFSVYDFEFERLENKGTFINGVKNFYPRQRFRYMFTDLRNKHDEKISENLELKIKYSDINNKKYERKINLSLNELTGIGMVSPPDTFMGRISFELTELKKILKSFIESNKK